MRRLGRVAALIAAFGLLGCSSLNPFSSSGPKIPPLKPITDSVKLGEDWKLRVGSAGTSVFSPLVVGSAVYAAAADGTVVRVEDGRTVWKVSLKTGLSGGVGGSAEMVLVASPKGEVYALDPASGAIRWQANVNAEVLAAPALGDGVVVVRAADSRLFGLEPADGKRRWVYQRATPALALRSAAGVVMADRAIFAGFPGGKLAAVNVNTGALMWEGTVSVPRGATELERVADISSPPVLNGRAACGVAYQGRVACFDLANGSTLWTRDLSSARGLDLDESHVFVTDDKGAVHALDLTSGASMWKQDQLAGRSPGRPLAFRDMVAVADVDGIVHVLRKDDGTFVGRQRTDGSPVLADLRRVGSDLLVQTRDGSVFAFGVQ
ncbi:MAG TPA: outer membrane protein assembly factor BamB [Rhodocyclaceae bacterium]|nr:outer membrane protein assembly factor BamB [Rhodocyclaceae bacterium]HMY48874.1 outer membrane protein assembly factor BamB [Rhodocyclaceae bacterium]HMZ75058.1 outer membrane protein assembly factor BamB [Rhodocyclaceae bacterium]HNA66183.1 outer membrane protein assembly factor BamB [Rhodocyclaceae bacterium]HNE14759.1 outer membrane protein assembly factor BamB [Rhodocyclaceae bacterium]